MVVLVERANVATAESSKVDIDLLLLYDIYHKEKVSLTEKG